MIKKVLVIAFLCLSLSAPALFAGTKMAVVDMQRVFKESKIAQKLARDFFKDLQSKRKELFAKEKDLKQKEIAFRKKRKGLSKKEREKELQKIREEKRKLKHIKDDMEDELRTKRQKMRVSIMKRVKEVISAYARKHNYAIVIPKGMLLYSQDAIDITDKIIKELNRKRQ